MARKRKKKSRRKARASTMSVDMTADERATIERAAAAEGLSPEAWARKHGLAAAAVDRMVADQQHQQQVEEAAAAIPRLSKADRHWMGQQLAQGGTTILTLGYRAGMKTDAARDKMIEAAQAFLDDVQSRVRARFATAPFETQRAIVHYFRTAITAWINEGAQHVAKMQYAASIFSEDEFFLWTHLYHATGEDAWTEVVQQSDALDREVASKDQHRERYLAELASCYADMKEGPEKDACLLAGDDFFNAYVYTGRKLLLIIVQDAQPELSKKPGRGAVRAYLRCVRQTHEAATKEGALRVLGAESPSDRPRALARLLWAALRNARVFEITSDIYNAISQEVFTYVWDKVAGLPGDKEPADLTPEEGQEALDRIWGEASRLPVFGDIMPFDHMFFGFDTSGLGLDDDRVNALMSEPPRHMIRARLIGILVGPVYGGEGVHCVMFVRVTEAGGKDYVVPCAERIGDKDKPPMWVNAPMLFPWIINALLSYVHEHRTTVIENTPAKGVRREYGKAAKAGGMTLIPQPYYTVPLRDVVIEDQAHRAVRGVVKRAPLSYRHDRRGHERCRIRRGKLPLDDKTRAKLVKRGYKVFTVQGLDADAQRQLVERRQPPKHMDEWLAIKTTWVDPTVVGPEDAPYVPAVRVSARSGMFDTAGGER